MKEVFEGLLKRWREIGLGIRKKREIRRYSDMYDKEVDGTARLLEIVKSSGRVYPEELFGETKWGESEREADVDRGGELLEETSAEEEASDATKESVNSSDEENDYMERHFEDDELELESEGRDLEEAI